MALEGRIIGVCQGKRSCPCSNVTPLQTPQSKPPRQEHTSSAMVDPTQGTRGLPKAAQESGPPPTWRSRGAKDATVTARMTTSISAAPPDTICANTLSPLFSSPVMANTKPSTAPGAREGGNNGIRMVYGAYKNSAGWTRGSAFWLPHGAGGLWQGQYWVIIEGEQQATQHGTFCTHGTR